ncbi:hypothetical protein [Lacticaseibacillus sharpeae]|uniref:hypothetical protein n=1 Tax=Lacticaseibacillus sharpeae TaxID=1626 RepID=UPI0021E8E509|nr:hypothetical protein [Lacticaseibacillus sharpeae]
MKLASFGTRVDEKPFLEAWAKRTGNEMQIFTETLNEDTLKLAADGTQGITGLQTVPYSAKLFQMMADRGINFLSIRNVGLDNIDLEGAKAAGVRISNVPAYSPSAIAEFAVTLVMHLCRNLGQVEQHLQNNDYNGACTTWVAKLGTPRWGSSGRVASAALPSRFSTASAPRSLPTTHSQLRTATSIT